MIDLAADTARVLEAGTLAKLGGPSADGKVVNEVRKIAVTFADQVYGVRTHSRHEALLEVPRTLVGLAFIDVERLVQPNGFE